MRILGFVRPYRFRLLAAVAALIAAAGAVLAFGQVSREVVDSAFATAVRRSLLSAAPC